MSKGFEALRKKAFAEVTEHLRDNPCRGIVLGSDNNENQVQLSWIMGRSPNSQNRIYVVEDEVLRTKPTDPSKVKDPSLIIYNAMRSSSLGHVVSNGDQTDSVLELAGRAVYFFRSFGQRYCEPDAPNFTPRITGLQSDTKNVLLSVLKADPFAREHWMDVQSRLVRGDYSSDKDFLDAVDKGVGLNRFEFPTLADEFTRPVRPGFGYCLTTYMPGSKKLPSFKGEPILVPIYDNLEKSMETFWNLLEPEWRVALGGREIVRGEVRYSKPINRFEEVLGVGK